MKWTEIPAGELHAAEQRLRVALGDNASQFVECINTNPLFAAALARFMTMGVELHSKDTISLNQQWVTARSIMGKNFFGVEEAIEHFGVNPTKQQLARLAEIPWSEEVLLACQHTHVLVAVFPMSILDIRGKAKRGHFRDYEHAWYNDEAFMKDKGKIGWQLVRKSPVANSTGKRWNDQQALLSKDEETPKSQVMVYTTIGHFLATSERLFENVFVCCLDTASGGFRLCIGGFDVGGLRISDTGDEVCNGAIGLPSAMKWFCSQ